MKSLFSEATIQCVFHVCQLVTSACIIKGTVGKQYHFSLSHIPSAVGSQKDILAALKAITSKSSVHREEEKVCRHAHGIHIRYCLVQIHFISSEQ